MFQLYCILKDREEPPTPDEIAIASGKKALDTHTEAEHVKKLGKTSESIRRAFEEQQARAAVSIVNTFFKVLAFIDGIHRGPGIRIDLSDRLLNGL
jgi:hypothetical protein